MKKSFVSAILVIFLMNLVLAGGRFFESGAGGYEAMYLPLDMEKIDTKLNNIGLSDIDNSIFLQGGGGWGNIGNNFRIGGYGYGGSIPTIKAKNNGIKRKFKMGISLGGFALEKAIQPLENTEVSIRCIIGGGNLNMTIKKQSNIPSSWDELWNEYKLNNSTGESPINYRSKLNTEFFMLAPSLGVRYYFLEWFGVGANLGYLYTDINQDKWEVDGNELYNAPEVDLSNIMFKVNFFFGR